MKTTLTPLACLKTALTAPRRLIRILCVDDHASVLDGLKARAALERDMEVVGSLSSADGLASEATRLAADIVVLDIEMAGPNPFEALDDLTRLCPKARAIILSGYVRDHYIDAAVSAGAWGYASKADDPSRLINAIRTVASGSVAFGHDVLQRCATKRNTGLPQMRNPEPTSPASRARTLTAREQEILGLIGTGLRRAQIALSLRVSPKTVDSHRASIMGKMNIHDRTGLALYAVREGLVVA